MVAMDMLHKIEGRSKPDRGIVMVTNGRSPYDAVNDQDPMNAVCEQCKKEGVPISV